MVSASNREINTQLHTARLKTRSPTDPNTAMTQVELADAINRYLIDSGAPDRELVTYRLISQYENGYVRWPGNSRRAAFRHVLGAATDAELGFFPPISSVREPLLTASDQPDNLPVPTPAGPEPAAVATIRGVSAAFYIADQQRGGGLLYPHVRRYLQAEVAPLLLDPDSGNAAAVFSAAASLTECAGWLAHDTGRNHLARQHFDRAFRLASAAADASQTAMACASMSYLAGELRHGEDAARLAETGLSHARQTSGTAALVARLHTMAARAHAMRMDRTSCLTALEEAHAVLQDRPDEVVDGGISGFDDATLAAESALCLQLLGDVDDAETQVLRTLGLLPADWVRSRALAHLTLAAVLKDSGRIAEAANAGCAVIMVARTVASTRVQVRLDRLGTELSQHQAIPEVQAFLDALASFRLGSTGKDCDTPAWPV
ncbi:hypothetical protein [Umezawaea sp. Da 62-37]|uniref:hypothetical protein n=1 Tax=Umezawaea sp. Da 62-37 TaxID=3075927 RepID=UPI0028F6C2C9|nr:hypothetical protein [Umezawaea sp. Da 62-37]WNV84968.1 hypothetical protein RM788_43570 [Umezawaea sp. Da 62-37]